MAFALLRGPVGFVTNERLYQSLCVQIRALRFNSRASLLNFECCLLQIFFAMEVYMNYLVFVLRLIHILAGVFWVGGSLVFAFFISPAVAATGEAGQKMMVHLVNKARFSTRIAISAVLTVIAGGWLYLIDSQGLTSAWRSSGPGFGFGIGGLFALVGLGFGLMIGMNSNRLGKLATEIQGKPTDAQLAGIQAAQRQLKFAVPIASAALILALICMATARYWVL